MLASNQVTSASFLPVSVDEQLWRSDQCLAFKIFGEGLHTHLASSSRDRKPRTWTLVQNQDERRAHDDYPNMNTAAGRLEHKEAQLSLLSILQRAFGSRGQSALCYSKHSASHYKDAARIFNNEPYCVGTNLYTSLRDEYSSSSSGKDRTRSLTKWLKTVKDKPTLNLTESSWTLFVPWWNKIYNAYDYIAHYSDIARIETMQVQQLKDLFVELNLVLPGKLTPTQPRWAFLICSTTPSSSNK